MQPGRQYDMLILGNSHAKNLSRHGNHRRMEAALDRRILNLGQGRGICGPDDQLFYLKYALSKNIRFDHLLIIVSPPYLYGDHINHNTKTFFEEPFRFDFFVQYLLHHAPNKVGRLLHYLRSKWRPLWLNYSPAPGLPMTDRLRSIDSTAINKGFELAYPEGREEGDFMKNAKYLEQSIDLARSTGADLTLLSTPTLFGHWPGQERLFKYVDSLQGVQPDIRYIDLSYAIESPTLYYDHHHLNSAGVDSLLMRLQEDGL